jgi:hypothetical protein
MPKNNEDNMNSILRNGSEIFKFYDNNIGIKLQDFWQWSNSDLLNNTTRGVLAEFIVAQALSLNLSEPRRDWTPWDLELKSGLKIEIKSSSYLQSWHQSKLSTISFTVKARKPWDYRTNLLGNKPKRTADIYIFALLKEQDRSKVNPMILEQWEFYIVETTDLDTRKRSQHSITLPSLRKISKAINYSEIKKEINKIEIKNKA